MKTVHNKHARFEALNVLILSCIGEAARHAQVSDVKRDGTIFIRFKSCDMMSAIEATETFGKYLTSVNIEFVQVDDVRVRMILP